jgi:hypothetical protein
MGASSKIKRMSCSYQINNKTPFIPNSEATEDDIGQCLDFCWAMTYGKSGEHRNHRTGGIQSRNHHAIFQDVFVGKMGEIAFYRWCVARNKSKVSEVDFSCFELGKWDSSDFILENNRGEELHISVKTTKYFGNLLLLEKMDWIAEEGKAIYLPNKISEDNGYYDFLVLCRVKSNLHELLSYIDESNKESLKSIQDNLKIELQVVGLVDNKFLLEVITSGKYTIFQGDILNSNTVMDADNYYIQSGSFILPK